MGGFGLCFSFIMSNLCLVSINVRGWSSKLKFENVIKFNKIKLYCMYARDWIE